MRAGRPRSQEDPPQSPRKRREAKTLPRLRGKQMRAGRPRSLRILSLSASREG